jgi:hypothetical protein
VLTHANNWPSIECRITKPDGVSEVIKKEPDIPEGIHSLPED